MTTTQTLIERSTTNGSQSIYHTTIMKVDDHKLRVRIRIDSYVRQSFVICERWNGEKWCEVLTPEFTLTPLVDISYLTKVETMGGEDAVETILDVVAETIHTACQIIL